MHVYVTVCGIGSYTRQRRPVVHTRSTLFNNQHRVNLRHLPYYDLGWSRQLCWK